MYITTKAISNKRRINKSAIYDAMRKYSIEYCVTAQELCSQGYSATPYTIDEVDFKTAITQEFPTETHLFISPLSARLSFDVPTLEYVYYATDIKDLRDIIKLYIRYKTAENKLIVCRQALDSLKFKKNGDVDINVRVIASEGVTDRTSFKLLPEFLFDKDYNKIEKVSIGGAVIEQLCYEIGMTDKEYRRHFRTGEPFFVKGVSQIEEANIARSITKGLVALDGKFGERLLKLMVNYYSDYFKNNSQYNTVQSPFETKVYINATPVICKYLSTVRDRVYANGGKELYIDNNFAYYQYKKNIRHRVPSKINIGGYCNLSETLELFEGIQGVFTQDIKAKNCVPMYVDEYGEVFLKKDTLYLEFTLDDIYEEYDCKSESDLINVIHKFTSDELTAELVLALLYARCGINSKDLTEVSEKYSLSAYQKSCEEALSIMRYTFNLL